VIRRTVDAVEASRLLRRMGSATEAEVRKALQTTARSTKEKAQRLSSGGFSLAQLRRMGHPYAKRHGRSRRGRFQQHAASLPYGDAAVINEQSGDFKKGWRAARVTRDGERLTARVHNVDPKADLLFEGTRFMIRRPILARLEAHARKVWPEHLARAVERGVRG
jgi:hypothetical protein